MESLKRLREKHGIHKEALPRESKRLSHDSLMKENPANSLSDFKQERPWYSKKGGAVKEIVRHEKCRTEDPLLVLKSRNKKK